MQDYIERKVAEEKENIVTNDDSGEVKFNELFNKAPSVGNAKFILVNSANSKPDFMYQKYDVVVCTDKSFKDISKDNALLKNGEYVLKHFFYKYKLFDILKFVYTYRAEFENFLRYKENKNQQS